MRIVAVGDNVVDCYPRLGRRYPGGNAYGVAVHARRCGAATGYVGAVGDDAAGTLMRDALHAEGVDTARLRVLPGATATATVDLVAGERTFLGNDKGISLITPTPDDLRYVASFDAAHTSCYSRLEEHLADLARRVPVSYDFGYRREPRYAVPLLVFCHLATFSGSDLSDERTDALLRWAHGNGARYALVTRGASGAHLFDGRRVHHKPTLSTTVVDTLGAGDSFIARTLVGLLAGEPVPQVLAAAAAVAAATCGHLGSIGRGAALPPDSRLPQVLVDVSRVFLERPPAALADTSRE